MKLDYQGSFLGFTYNGRHSSEFNIVRINTGNRASLLMSPTFQDTTIDRVGADGQYYFSTHNQNLTFQLDFGFEDLTEVQIRELRNWFNPKTMAAFYFDEIPYKQYMVKPQSQIKLSYIAFDVELYPENQIRGKQQLYGQNRIEHSGRIYKGEGQITFIAYDPLARAPYQTIEEYEELMLGRGYVNFDEWQDAAHILTEAQLSNYNQTISLTNGTAGSTPLYNAGDVDSPLKFTFKVTSLPTDPSSSYIKVWVTRQNYDEDEYTVKTLLISLANIQVSTDTTEYLYVVDSEKLLITLDDEPVNSIIAAGEFLKVPAADVDTELTLRAIADTSTEAQISSIQYDYLYL